jgi:hypothetical protein
VTGIILGFMGNWWGQLWIWASLVVLVLVFVGMQVRGSGYLTKLRKALGAPYFERMGLQEPLPPASPDEINALRSVSSSRGAELLGMGGIALLLLLWLMTLKPF